MAASELEPALAAQAAQAARAASEEPATAAPSGTDSKEEASQEAATMVKDEVELPDFHTRWPMEDDRTSSGNDGVDGGITFLTSRCLM